MGNLSDPNIYYRTINRPGCPCDSRGDFMKTYNKNDMREAGLDMVFVQDNQSMSTKGVLRGLHFRKQYPQGKLFRVIKGRAFDRVTDLRTGSETQKLVSVIVN